LGRHGVPESGEDLSIDLGQRSSVQCHQLTSPVNQLTDRTLLHVRVSDNAVGREGVAMH